MPITLENFTLETFNWPIPEVGGGGVGPAPSQPTIVAVDNGNGTATVTVSGSSALAVNVVWTLASVGGTTWINSGSRVGNGDVVITLADGRYFVYVLSTLNSQNALSNIEVLRMGVGSNGLEHSPAHITAALLWTTSVGSQPTNPPLAWPIYYGSEPDAPDELVTVYDTSGRLDGRMQFDGEVQEAYGLQFRIRSDTHQPGYAQARALADMIDEGIYQDVVTIGATEYLVHSLSRTGGILSLGRESPYSNRKVFTLNAVVSLRQTS